MSNQSRRSFLHRQPTVQDNILGIVGTIGAIGGVAAVTAKVMNDIYAGRSSNASRPCPIPPLPVKRQILGFGVPQNYDYNNDEGPMFTMEDLSNLASKLREEMSNCMSTNEWARLHTLSETQQIVDEIVDLRDKIDDAQQIGDYEAVTSLTPQVQMRQQELVRQQRNLPEGFLANPIPSSTNNMAVSDQHSVSSVSVAGVDGDDIEKPKSFSQPSLSEGLSEHLSRAEVEEIMKTLDSKMGVVDTGTHDGMSKWRKFFAEKERLGKILQTFEEIEEAKASQNNGDQLEKLYDEMSTLQNVVLSHEKPAARSSSKPGIIEGIKKCFGITRHGKGHEDSASKANSEVVSKTAKKRQKRTSSTISAKDSIANSVKSRRVVKPSNTESIVQVSLPPRKRQLQVYNKVRKVEVQISPQDDVTNFHPENMNNICPTLIPWLSCPRPPESKSDLSDEALAYSAPHGTLTIPRKGSLICNLGEKQIIKFINAARYLTDRSSRNLQSVLPEGCTLDEGQTRNLFRNFSDSKNVACDKDSILITRRELDILLFCKRRDELKPVDCHRLISYRNLLDVQNIWNELSPRINVATLMSDEYMSDLRKRAGLLAQLEGLWGATSVLTRGGRTVLPPPNFIAETGSFVPRNGSVCSSTGDKTPKALGSSISGKEVAFLKGDENACNTDDENAFNKNDEYVDKPSTKDPTWPSGTQFVEGTIIHDTDNRTYYIARDDETLEQTAQQLAESEGEEPTVERLNALIEANSSKWGGLKCGAPLKGGTILILPPHSWPMNVPSKKKKD